jgi:hypothetical protein
MGDAAYGLAACFRAVASGPSYADADEASLAEGS